MSAESVADQIRSAHTEAEAVLEGGGFAKDRNGIWRGSIDLAGYGIARLVKISVRLPPAFPFALPEIFIDREELDGVPAHIEWSGKVCLAPTTGVLINDSLPTSLIRESLEKAGQTLTDNFLGRSGDDLRREFLAYWDPPNETPLVFLGPIPAAPAMLPTARVDSKGWWKDKRIVAGDESTLRKWLGRTNLDSHLVQPSLFVPLGVMIDPPPREPVLTLAWVKTLARGLGPPRYGQVRELAAERGLPLSVILSLQGPKELGVTLVGVEVPGGGPIRGRGAQGTKGKDGKRLDRLFQLHEALSRPVFRQKVLRLDPTFLLRRGGGVGALVDKKVCLIGCGAVGSHAACELAAAGVGELTLVDTETLAPENLHRHSLGVPWLGRPKAEGLATVLSQQYPHQAFLPIQEDARDLFLKDPDSARRFDLVISATGDETTERFLNSILQSLVPCIHVWVEPLELGSHCVRVGAPGSRGCFECLYEDSNLGLTNRLVLVAPGQVVQESYAGCAGVFTPFPSRAAVRAGLDAVSLAAEFLVGSATESAAVTWFGDASQSTQQGLRLSNRAQRLVPRTMTVVTDFARRDCRVCGGRTQ